jgi:hypothetical protein
MSHLVAVNLDFLLEFQSDAEGWEGWEGCPSSRNAHDIGCHPKSQRTVSTPSAKGFQQLRAFVQAEQVNTVNCTEGFQSFATSVTYLINLLTGSYGQPLQMSPVMRSFGQVRVVEMAPPSRRRGSRWVEPLQSEKAKHHVLKRRCHGQGHGYIQQVQQNEKETMWRDV